MEKILLLAFPVFFSALLFVPAASAQQIITKEKLSLHPYRPKFTENKGQFLSLEDKKPAENALFKLTSPGADLYITTRGLSYVFSKLKNAPPAPENIAVENRNKTALKTGYEKKTIPKMHYEIERVDMNLEKAVISAKKTEVFYHEDKALYYYYGKNKTPEILRGIEKVIIHDIYPGIDWVLYFQDGGGLVSLKQDFILHPGADPTDLVFNYSGNAKWKVDSSGKLLIKSRMGEISEEKPYVYEEETRFAIPVKRVGKNKKLFYRLPENRVSRTTVIDPVLYWGTAITSDVTGIDYNDQVTGDDVQTDNTGNIFALLSITKGVSFPNINPGNGAYYQDFANTPDGGMDIAKFTSDGILLWSSFFGEATAGNAMATDPSGNLYVSGMESAGGTAPLLNNGGYFDSTSKANFVAKFSTHGQLLWSSYFGDFEMQVSRLLCDSKGNLYINGVSYPQTFPFMNPGGNAYQFSGAGLYAQGPFISEFSSSNQLIWSTQINGMAYYNSPQRMAIDPLDNLYLMNDSVRLFNTAHEETWSDATVGWPYLQDIAADRQGNVFVVGFGPGAIVKTDPGNGAFIDNSPSSGFSTGFIVKYNNAHQRVWSTPFFNQAMTDIYRIVADKKCDAVHLFGVTNSFPGQVPTMDSSCSGDFYFSNTQILFNDAPIFVTFKTSGKLIYSSLSNFPENYYNQGLSFSTDNAGDLIYLFGQINNFSNLPALMNPGNGAFFQPNSNNVSVSAFLMKLVPSPINVTISVDTPTGCSCNGSASIQVLCGVAPFSYLWSTGGTSASVSGLCSGKYTVTVTDDNCNDTLITFVIPPAPGSITGFSPVIRNDHCNQSQGSISVASVQGGTPPYQYAIDSLAPQSTGLFTGLTAGAYLITITDVNHCAYRDSALILNISGPDSLYFSLSPASCAGMDGSIRIDSVSGGTLPFEYSLNSQAYQNSALFQDLGAGTYYLQIRDSAGCFLGDSVSLSQSLPPAGAALIGSGAHCGQPDGSFAIESVSGGIPPYTYSMDGRAYQQDSVFATLPAGPYYFYIKDSKNCLFEDSVNIQAITGPDSASLNIANALCNIPYGKMAIQQVQGGTAPYRYSLSDSAFSPLSVFDSLKPGNYTLFIMDSAGCLLNQAFAVTATRSTPVKIFPGDSTACYGETIIFSVITGNGPALRSYSWNSGQGDSPTFPVTAEDQEYIVLSALNDSNCISGDTAMLNIRNCDSTIDNCVHFPNAFTPNNDGRNDLFGAIAECQLSGYKLNVYNRYGQLVFSSADISKKWDGSLNGSPQDTGNYVYFCEYQIGPLKKFKKGFVVLLR